MKQARQIFRDALLLTTAAFLMKTAGVAFGVAVSRRAGAEAMGLFSLIAGVYGFALTLATSGIQLGVTRVVTETVSRGNPERVGAILRRAVFYALLCGSLAALLLLSGASLIGTRFLHDVRTVVPLRLFALTLPLISFSSVACGYFVAVRHSRRNAAVQILEQVLKFALTVLLLTLTTPDSAERICSLLVLGGAAAEVVSFLVGLVIFLCDRRRATRGLLPESAPAEQRDLLKITVPVALTTYVRSGLITLSHALVPAGLQAGGMTHTEALSAYGIIHSMALPVILYPSALIYSFGGLVIPAMADGMVENSPRHIRYMISRVLSLSLFFSIGVAGILVFFSAPLGELLYPGTGTGCYLRLLAPLIPVMYVDGAVDSMLKGMGEQLTSMRINVADALISVLLVRFLVPRWGIPGYLFAIWFSECFNTVLSITRLLTVGGAKVQLCKWVWKPLLSVVAATWGAHFLFAGSVSVPSAPALTLQILTAALLYLLLLLLLRGIDREDLTWFRGLLSRTTETDGAPDAPPVRTPASAAGRRNPPPASAAFPPGRPAPSGQSKCACATAECRCCAGSRTARRLMQAPGSADGRSADAPLPPYRPPCR